MLLLLPVLQSTRLPTKLTKFRPRTWIHWVTDLVYIENKFPLNMPQHTALALPPRDSEGQGRGSGLRLQAADKHITSSGLSEIQDSRAISAGFSSEPRLLHCSPLPPVQLMSCLASGQLQVLGRSWDIPGARPFWLTWLYSDLCFMHMFSQNSM